jgi:aquaporin Z
MKSFLPLFFAEMIGTALLLGVGLSVVIFNWGEASDLARMIPSVEMRRFLTGFLFGTTGCLITLSPVGRISGAHINPAMSFAFWLRGKMKTYALIGYVIAQLIGAAIGSLPLFFWGNQGKSIQYGITLPGPAGLAAAFTGELVTTMTLVILVFVFVGSKRLRNYTPFTMPFLYGFMVWGETVYSGCSTNPARSFGPALISNFYDHFWIYLAAPLLAAGIVVGLFKLLRLHKLLHIKAARISFHDSATHDCLKGVDMQTFTISK